MKTTEEVDWKDIHRLTRFDTKQQKPYHNSQELSLESFKGIIVERARNYLTITGLAGLGLALQACSGLGYQGGVIPTNFAGITTAKAVSPQTISLEWNAYPGASKYSVYTPDQNSAVYSPGFTSILFKPVPNDPSLTYQYSVTAADPVTGKEQGDRSQYLPVQLLPHFNFRADGSVTPINKTSIRVNWTGNPTVSYMIYVAERLPTGQVNYNNFVSSSLTVPGQSTGVVTGLQEGREYCALAIAAYSDQTNDGPDGVSFTGDVGTRLSSAAYSVGTSGNFGDSIVAQSQKCTRTVSDFNVSTIKIYAPKATLSNRPIFYVAVPGDISEDSSGTVTTTIYQFNETTGLSTLVGSRIGTGRIIAQASMPTGRYKFFAIINDLSGSNAQAKLEILVAPTFTLPPTEQDRRYVYVRSFNTTESTTAPAGYFPEKQQGGYGSQSGGSAVAIGDFNCDGHMDIAVGIPQASVMAADNRPAKQGKVVIYFDTTSSTPSATTRSQTITFDITGFVNNDNSRDLQLGTSLYVGNFNNDNQQTNQPVSGVSSGLNKNFKCDDLAIGSGYGPMFMLYGKRDVSGNDGGLNYIGPTSYTINPSASCDPTSNVCQPAVYLQGGTAATPVGVHYTSGDYNGDGYEDLATVNGYGSGVWVFRGSEYGLIAPSPYGPEGITTTAGPYLNFPFIPASPAGFSLPAPAPGTGWGAGGQSISTFHNAFYDTNPGATKGSKRIRDVLLIGNPNNNLINSCIPTSDYTLGAFGTIGSANDVNTGLYWDCSKIITAPAGVSGLGAAMTDIKNALRYRPDQFTNSGCTPGFGNCSVSTSNLGYPGAVAVSSVATTSAYIYYLVNNPASYTPGAPSTIADRDTLGLNRNAYLNSKIFTAGVLTLTSSTPCSVNTGLSTEICQIQQIQHPTSGTGGFGTSIHALSGNVGVTVDQAKDTLLAITAPYKNFTLSNGTTYKEVGSVQLFSQNSRFVSNPIVVVGTNACGATSICRYSDGFSNSLTTAIDYDAALTDNIHFGLGGVVAGPLIPTSDLANYSSNSDIIVGAPGHVARNTDSTGTYNVIDNGGAFTYFSQAGVYRNYRITDTSGPTAWHTIDQSVSQESDMKFHQAISMGDINQDNVGDVAVRINQGSRNFIRIYNGRSDQVGLNRSAGSYTNLNIQGDPTGGIRFAPLGNITNSSLPAYFVTGAKQSYLYFAGIGGLVQGFPSAFGAGGTPRKLYAPSLYAAIDPNFTFTPSRLISYLDFSDRSIYNSETMGQIDTTLSAYSSFTHGDFNGDGYEDFAIGFGGSLSIADATAAPNAGKKCFATNNYCGTEGVGRVMIFYGGADNGIQTQPDTYGGYPMSSSFFTDYKSDATASVRSNFGDPCLADGSGCKIQMLHEPNTTVYGSSITSVPAGNCVDSASAQHPVSALVVASNTASGSKLFMYRPRCLDSTTPNTMSGLVGYNDASGTGGWIFSQTASVLQIPGDSSATLGLAMTSITKLMGSAPSLPASSALKSHLVVTDQTNSRILVYPVHAIDTNKESFETYDPANSTALADGARKIDYSSSSMMSATSGTASFFGTGISAVGDLNGDGYNDIAISISKLARKDTSSQSLAQGATLMLFGGPAGLQSHSNAALTNIIEPARVSSCYVYPVAGLPTSACNPTLLYTPQAANSIRDGSYERTSINPFSAVNVGALSNEGLGTFLIGIPGKDSLDDLPNKRLLQGGAFYELP